MIASLNGKLIYKDATTAVIECGGVGFKCAITANTFSSLPLVDNNVFLYTYLSVREDALDLFGFSSSEELNMFKLITSVSGVGPKIGLAILSAFSPDNVILYIASGDAKSLTGASGVGIKLAQRIILELKDKIGSTSFGLQSDTVAKIGNVNAGSNTKDAIEALVTFGYSQSEASLAIGKLDSSLSTDELIKLALKSLGRGMF